MSKLAKTVFVSVMAVSLFLGSLVPLFGKSLEAAAFDPRVYVSDQQSDNVLPAVKSNSQRNGLPQHCRTLSFTTINKANENKSAYTLYICFDGQSTDYSQIRTLFCQRTLLII